MIKMNDCELTALTFFLDFCPLPSEFSTPQTFCERRNFFSERKFYNSK